MKDKDLLIKLQKDQLSSREIYINEHIKHLKQQIELLQEQIKCYEMDIAIINIERDDLKKVG
jgi:hypothetical protein